MQQIWAMEPASIPKQHVWFKGSQNQHNRRTLQASLWKQKDGQFTALQESERAKNWFFKTMYVFKMRGRDILAFFLHASWIPYINATETMVCGLEPIHKLFLIQDKESAEIKRNNFYTNLKE